MGLGAGGGDPGGDTVGECLADSASASGTGTLAVTLTAVAKHHSLSAQCREHSAFAADTTVRWS